MKNKFILFDLVGTLVKMRPAKLLANKSLLEKLKKKYLLGIITGAKRRETLNLLKKLEIEKLFKIVITADDNKIRKPDAKLFPKKKIVGYIGDTKKDEVFARNAGVPFFRVNKKCKIDQIIKKII